MAGAATRPPCVRRIPADGSLWPRYDALEMNESRTVSQQSAVCPRAPRVSPRRYRSGLVFAAALVVALWAQGLQAQTTPGQECREPWVPKDAPAVCAFAQGPRLPGPRTYHASVASDSTLYVAGGYMFDGTAVRYLDDLVWAHIREDGTLTNWVRAPQPFARGRSGLGLALVGRCLFLAGGSWFDDGKSQYAGDVQSAELGPDGVPGAWRTSPYKLNIPRSNASLLAYTGPNGSFLYMVAGVAEIGANVVHLDQVEYTRVNPDCTTSPWKVAEYHLHGGRSSPQAVLLDSQLVVVGGWGDLDLIDVYSDVLITRVRQDGSIEPWRRSSAHLPTGSYGHATAVMDAPQNARMLLTVGGQPGTGAYANWMSYAYAFKNMPMSNAVTAWSIAPVGRLPSARAGHTAHVIRGMLYVIGGNTAAGQYLDEVLQARISPGEPGGD